MPGIRLTKRPPDGPEHHSNLRYNRCYAVTFVRLYARRDTSVQTGLGYPGMAGRAVAGTRKFVVTWTTLRVTGRPGAALAATPNPAA